MQKVLDQRLGELMNLSKFEKVFQIGKFHILSQEFLILSGQLLTKGLREERHGEAWLLLQQVVAEAFGVDIAFVKLSDRESLKEAG
jgi:hypothetical protein